jgi:hypothetical protein
MAGAGVGETIAHVELRRVLALAVPVEGIEGDSGGFRGTGKVRMSASSRNRSRLFRVSLMDFPDSLASVTVAFLG